MDERWVKLTRFRCALTFFVQRPTKGGIQAPASYTRYTNTVQRASYLIPTNFLFKGPPGTGKTTTARKMGSVYYDIGLLASREVVECSASDLVGEYTGQTGPKTTKLLRKALGKVLFIDEAYRLCDGPFAKEAVDELVGILTQEEFAGRLVVILAGYDNEINRLLSMNPGLPSRFPEEIRFDNFTPVTCLHILDKKLSKEDVSCPSISSTDKECRQELLHLFGSLSSLPFWGNARDVEELSRRMLRTAYKRAAESAVVELSLSPQDAIVCAKIMLNERRARLTSLPAEEKTSVQPQALPQFYPSFEHSTSMAQPSASIDAEPAKPELEEDGCKIGLGEEGVQRDLGVSDAV
ncbi:P-loop containing nucleoside triphosphate hydrolase protein [Calocera viscosa TUFC12733]|uniref:p-loop containing nucleoside triphosphate hydrolase protein n=1 Tax=Calocera viscosa (strain TUFC12733) TaxID=1330018 RepID=A0A167PEM4_CALVF|nr:P-loop containing nucleoside triphosphate hydrolase protein [Calocera viscosa TUFC12733]